MSFDEIVRRRIVITGRVQGVGFRAAALKEVERIGRRLGTVTGFVRNCPDGSVEIVVQGETEAVDALTDWAREGPSSARVDEVKVEDSDMETRLKGFEIK